MVAKSKLAARRLTQFTTSLRKFTNAAIPTVTALSALIHNPAGTGDLTTLLNETPRLANLAATAFPHLIQAMNASQNQLDNLRCGSLLRFRAVFCRSRGHPAPGSLSPVRT